MQFDRAVSKAQFRGHLILASSSPRRRKLLEAAGYDFEVIVPALGEEHLHHPQDPRRLAESLAYAKARQVADRLEQDVVLGADTIVALDDECLGKPRDEADARAILKRLSGSTHQVITGICLINARRGERLIGADVTLVTLRRMTQPELDAYVASGEGMGKAGAYAIQENGDRFVEKIDGSFTNVVGLPMEMLSELLGVMERLIVRR